jgi:uncharacterized protein (DUF983 family)
MILKKGNKLYSILTGKCPKCHHELMYKNSNAYQLSETLEMHERCAHCQTKYKIEPSFFYGSMYVSYGVTLIGFMPIIMRLSRNIWINLFMSYDAQLAKKKQPQND